MRRLSIVIPNHDYGRFVTEAVESALAVDWPDVEVVVVDDGSTDDSRERILAFGDRIDAVFQANAGPRTACNVGFARTTGDVVIFLDSDDVLEPDVATAIAPLMTPGVSKVQFPMRRIDGDGNEAGDVTPHYRYAPTPEQVRVWMRETAAYPTPPGSGNAYTRAFLERLFPLGPECGESTDSACLAAAPFLGDVVTLDRPLARYRIHGDNRSRLGMDPAVFSKQILRSWQRHVFAQTVAGYDPEDVRPLFRGRHLLQLRVAAHRLDPQGTVLPRDSAGRMLRDALASPWRPGPESLSHRAMVLGWSIATLTSPRPLAHRLIQKRFRHGGPRRARGPEVTPS